jgi:energy-coupling factor transport system substrate-specific component
VIDYIRATSPGAGDTGALERTILVLGAAGISPRSFGGRDLVAALLRHRRRDGSFDRQVNLTAFGVLALRAAGYRTSAAPVRAAAGWIAAQQNRDGGFNFAAGGGFSGIDDTSAPLQALAAAVRLNGHTPLGYLRSLTAPDGSIRYSRTSGQTPVWVTAQVLTALARRPFPLARVPRHSVARVAAATRGKAKARAAGNGGRRPIAIAPRSQEAALVRAAGMAGLLAGWLLPLTR